MDVSSMSEREGSQANVGKPAENAGVQMGPVAVPVEAQPGQSRQLTLTEHYQFQRLHWRHWYGFHTVYNAVTGDVVESYRMERHLHEAEPDGARIIHNNTQHKASGKVCAGPWIFGPENSGPDGVGHPASTEIVSHQVPSGDSAWHAREVPDGPGKAFIIELFFPVPGHESRLSLLVAYNRQTYKAKSLLYAREETWNEHEKKSSWSTSTEVLNERPSPGESLTGLEITVTSDLGLSEVPGTWKGFEQPVGEPLPGRQLPRSEYKLVHLPDGLSVYFPVQAERGAGSFHVSGHLLGDGGVHSLSVLYAENGRFDSLKSARYSAGGVGFRDKEALVGHRIE